MTPQLQGIIAGPLGQQFIVGWTNNVNDHSGAADPIIPLVPFELNQCEDSPTTPAPLAPVPVSATPVTTVRPFVGGFDPALGQLQPFTSNAPELIFSRKRARPRMMGVPFEAPDVAGMDLRDMQGSDLTAMSGVPGVGLAWRLLKSIMGTATRVTAEHWNSLPGWAQSLLSGIGVAIGVDLAQGIRGVPGESQVLDIFDNGPMRARDLPEVAPLMGHQIPHMVDGHLGDHIIGSWVANGVRFYRLASGKLAVQNKAGKWKVWMPKKPIVIMPTGANNLRTLLRADNVLTRQSKRLRKMLDRRAPRTRRPRQMAATADHAHEVSVKPV